MSRTRGFTLEWVDPFHAITVNRRHAHGPADLAMLEREALVLEALIREAWLPSGDPQRLSLPGSRAVTQSGRSRARTSRRIMRFPAAICFFMSITSRSSQSKSILEDLSRFRPESRPRISSISASLWGDRLAAVMDLILDYPERGIAFLGFFHDGAVASGAAARAARSFRNALRTLPPWDSVRRASPLTAATRRAAHSGRKTALL